MVQVGGLTFLEEEKAFGLWHPTIMPLLLKYEEEKILKQWIVQTKVKEGIFPQTLVLENCSLGLDRRTKVAPWPGISVFAQALLFFQGARAQTQVILFIFLSSLSLTN